MPCFIKNKITFLLFYNTLVSNKLKFISQAFGGTARRGPKPFNAHMRKRKFLFLGGRNGGRRVSFAAVLKSKHIQC